MLSLFGKILFLLRKFNNKCISAFYKKQFKNCGKNVYISQGCVFTQKNISLGDNVYFGPNCIIQSAHGEIKIGNHVMFGPGVNVHGGNHKFDNVNCYMDEIKKEPGEDPTLIIEDDVWIGANAIILAGVRIGRGSVIGAGSIVTKEVEPYSVVVGNPGEVIRKRIIE